MIGTTAKSTASARSRLQRIAEWETLARRARYHVDDLAQACSISPRQLHRFFLSHFGKPPKSWLKELRMQDALEILRHGKSVKEASFQVGFKAPEELSREIKRVTGFSALQITISTDRLFSNEMSDSVMKCPNPSPDLSRQVPPRA